MQGGPNDSSVSRKSSFNPTGSALKLKAFAGEISSLRRR